MRCRREFIPILSPALSDLGKFMEGERKRLSAASSAQKQAAEYRKLKAGAAARARRAARGVTTTRLGIKMLCKTHNTVERVKKSVGWAVVLTCGCERPANPNGQTTPKPLDRGVGL